jgi:hypothetical protein
MGTRSTIAMEFDDGTIKQVYCHWDGYLSNNGVILQEHYSDKAKLNELISFGSISSLGPTIGEKHPFDNPYSFFSKEYDAENIRRRTMTTFYGRDRGETEDVGYNQYADFEDYVNNAQREEFNYILRNDGNWYVDEDYDGGFVLLSEALVRLDEEDYE